MDTSIKNRKIIWILVVAVLFMAATGFLIFRYLTPKKTTIYTFRDNYKAGQPVTDEILVPMQIDSSVVIAGAQTDTTSQFVTPANRADLLDRKANSLRMDVTKGMPLLQSMLSTDGGSYIEMNMDDKKIAVTVPITGISGVTKDLKPGSRVNIYATGKGSYNVSNTTELIFENMRVLSVTKDDGYLSAATVEVTLDESLKLINAAQNSSIYFGLVNGAGYQATGEIGLMYPFDGMEVPEGTPDLAEADALYTGGFDENTESAISEPASAIPAVEIQSADDTEMYEEPMPEEEVWSSQSVELDVAE